jgi:hypothetical protein
MGERSNSAEDSLELGTSSDVRLPCIAVLDPHGLWQYVERPVKVYMPLKNLKLTSPTTGTIATVEELPVQIIVHTSKQSEEEANIRFSAEPWKWYRGPFAHVHIITAESQDHYKNIVRPLLRSWVDEQESRPSTRGGWLILYVNLASQKDAKGGDEMHGKIFGWLCADFYSKTPGDRTTLVALYLDDQSLAEARRSIASGGSTHSGGVRSNSQAQRAIGSPRHHPKQWNDLIVKLGRVVVDTFSVRGHLYEAELQRLDEKRGEATWDFASFFLVKEALALMYRQIGMPNEALLKYQELAALIMSLSDRAQAGPQSAGRDPTCLLYGLVNAHSRRPYSVLDYHHMRFRERLKLKRLVSTVLETQIYIFARECQLYLEMQQPCEMAHCGSGFIPAFYNELLALASPDIPIARVELWALKAVWDVIKECGKFHANDNPLPPPGSKMFFSTSQVLETNAAQLASTSAELSELLWFAVDRLLECAKCVSSTQVLKKSGVWELQDRGYLEELQQWVPSGRPDLGATQDDMNVSFWDSDEEGDVCLGERRVQNPIGQLVRNKSWAEISSPAPEQLDLLSSEADELEEPLASPAMSRASSNASFTRSSQISGLQTIAEFDCLYLQLTHSLAKHLKQAGRLRMSTMVQRRRCDLLMHHGKWKSAAKLLGESAKDAPSDKWPLLEFWRLHRLGMCYYHLNEVDAYVDSVMRMCRCASEIVMAGSTYPAVLGSLMSYAKDQSLHHEGLSSPFESLLSPRILLMKPSREYPLTVGDAVEAECTLTSYLTSAIELTDLCLELEVLVSTWASMDQDGGSDLDGVVPGKETTLVKSHRVAGPICVGAGDSCPVGFTLSCPSAGMVFARRLTARWGLVHLSHTFVETVNGGAAVSPFKPASIVRIQSPPFFPFGEESEIIVTVSALGNHIHGPNLLVTCKGAATLGTNVAVPTGNGEAKIIVSVVSDESISVDISRDMSPGDVIEIRIPIQGHAPPADGHESPPASATFSCSLTGRHLRKETSPPGVLCTVLAEPLTVPVCAPFEATCIPLVDPSGTLVVQVGLKNVISVPLVIISHSVHMSDGVNPMDTVDETINSSILEPGRVVYLSMSASIADECVSPSASLRLEYTVSGVEPKKQAHPPLLLGTGESEADSWAAYLSARQSFHFEAPIFFSMDGAAPVSAASVIITCSVRALKASSVCAPLGMAGPNHPPVLCRKGMPQIFEFSVGATGEVGMVDFEIDPGDDWLVCGQVKGSASLGTPGARVTWASQLIPLTCGLIHLPVLRSRLSVGSPIRNVCMLDSRCSMPARDGQCPFVLVLPPGVAVNVTGW